MRWYCRGSFYIQLIVFLDPKKTLNLLQTLLNYVLYYNMVKDEVVGATKTSMIKFREMTEKKQQCIKDNEHNKNMTKQVCTYLAIS